MRRIAEKIFKLSDADETEVEIGVVSDALTRFANNTIHQNVAEQVLDGFGANRARWPHGARDHEQDRRRIAAPRGRRLQSAGAQPAAQSRSAADARAAEIRQGFALFRKHGARHARRSRSRRRPRGGNGRKEQADRRRNFHHGRDAIGDRQYAAACSLRIARRAPNFPSPFWNPIPPAGPRPTRPISAASIRTRWPAAPAKNPPHRAIRAKPRRAGGP